MICAHPTFRGNSGSEETHEGVYQVGCGVTTHSPYFIDGLSPEDVRVLSRGRDGYTQAHRVSKMPGIQAFMDEGAKLGELWMEGHFEHGDPFAEGLGAGPRAVQPR